MGETVLSLSITTRASLLQLGMRCRPRSYDCNVISPIDRMVWALANATQLIQSTAFRSDGTTTIGNLVYFKLCGARCAPRRTSLAVWVSASSVERQHFAAVYASIVAGEIDSSCGVFRIGLGNGVLSTRPAAGGRLHRVVAAVTILSVYSSIKTQEVHRLSLSAGEDVVLAFSRNDGIPGQRSLPQTQLQRRMKIPKGARQGRAVSTL